MLLVVLQSILSSPASKMPLKHWQALQLPPQSIPVSSPFCILSLQIGVLHTFKTWLHEPDLQSSFVLQLWLISHFLQEPPQSISVSLESRIPFEQLATPVVLTVFCVPRNWNKSLRLKLPEIDAEKKGDKNITIITIAAEIKTKSRFLCSEVLLWGATSV